MSGKNNKLIFFIKGGGRYLAPNFLARIRRRRILARFDKLPPEEQRYIRARVDYCNKLSQTTALPPDSPTLGQFRLKGHGSAYFFDSQEWTRFFAPGLKWQYVFGDVTHVPGVPSIVKSRPVAGDNANSVLLNLDKARHFVFLDDRTPWREKADKAIFRVDIGGKPQRIRFMELYHGKPFCDAGCVYDDPVFPRGWLVPKISLAAHLGYKFIVALQGVDVATNLKWIMSTNSLAVMPRPVYESWFMDGRLIPGVHYVEIRADLTDLEERMNHYITHPDEAEAILRNAHEYVAQFRNKRRERLVHLMVLQKYFGKTGQLGPEART